MAGRVILKLITAAGSLTSHHVGNVPLDMKEQGKYEAIKIVNEKTSGIQNDNFNTCTGPKLQYDLKKDGTHEITCDLTSKGGKRGLKSRKSKKSKQKKSLKKKRKQTKKRKSLKKKRKTRRK
jgi:hypothetical protein